MPANRSYYAHGKIILTAEYGVLSGAWALGLPLRWGQKMRVAERAGSALIWTSKDHQKRDWFKAKFDLIDFELLNTTDEQKATYLKEIFRAAIRFNSDFLSKWKKYEVTTVLDFSPEWGFGSSSSFLSCLADWAEVNPYHLFFAVSNGSGCDMACARADGPILYRKTKDELFIEPVDFDPPFAHQLYLVYSGNKMKSSEAVAKYKGGSEDPAAVQALSALTKEILSANSLADFCSLIEEHEKVVGNLIDEEPVGQKLFADFPGSIKSLGAWGGDCILAATELPEEDVHAYFSSKTLNQVMRYESLVLNPSEQYHPNS